MMGGSGGRRSAHLLHGRTTGLPWRWRRAYGGSSNQGARKTAVCDAHWVLEMIYLRFGGGPVSQDHVEVVFLEI